MIVVLRGERGVEGGEDPVETYRGNAPHHGVVATPAASWLTSL